MSDLFNEREQRLKATMCYISVHIGAYSNNKNIVGSFFYISALVIVPISNTLMISDQVLTFLNLFKQTIFYLPF